MTQLLSPADRDQVRAILMTHAEMQDHRTLHTESVIARMRAERSEDGDVKGMIDELSQSANEMIEDSENLKRIASKFEG